ncbi:MAG: RES family NAD+ phosphorylase [Burkholderiales bacterium]
MASRSPPPPPDHLDRIDLPVVSIDPASLLRLFPLGRPSMHFRVASKGQRAHRFDAPNGEFGVMYCAFSLEVCFAETLLRTRAYQTPADQPTLVDESELRARGIAWLDGNAGQQLVLADLTGSGLVRLHVDGSISTAARYTVPRQWALALWKHPKRVDGIRYVSRFMNSQLAVALFDRCEHRLVVRHTQPLIDHADSPRILDLFNVGI